MLTNTNPKLPMRDKILTKNFYVNQLNFKILGEFDDYLIVGKDKIEIHFFGFKTLDPKENYGQVYIRTDNIDTLYQSLLENNIQIHPNGSLRLQPWGQKEFSLLDPDNNLLTFGQKTKNMNQHKIVPCLWFHIEGGTIAEVTHYYKTIFGENFQEGPVIPLGETPSGTTEMCEVYLFEKNIRL